MELMLGEWDHAHFEHLAHSLSRVQSNPGPSDIQRLHKDLEGAKPWLIRLGDVPGPSEQARRDVEQSKYSGHNITTID
jgi:hypothetical protein